MGEVLVEVVESAPRIDLVAIQCVIKSLPFIDLVSMASIVSKGVCIGSGFVLQIKLVPATGMVPHPEGLQQGIAVSPVVLTLPGPLLVKGSIGHSGG